jgi:hypothetical protein
VNKKVTVLAILGIFLLLAGCTPVAPDEILDGTPDSNNSKIFAPVAPGSGAGGSATTESEPKSNESGPAYPAGEGAGSEAEMEIGTAFVQESNLIVSEDPPGVDLAISGGLPTPCHFLDWEISPPDQEGVIRVKVFSRFDPEMICAQVIKPFEETIALTDLPQGEYKVLVNGEEAGEFELDEDM